MVQVGTPQEIIINPVNDYIREFTLDVNRAQVLTTGSILRRTRPFVIGQGATQAALNQMREYDRRRMFVVCAERRPLGLLLLEELEAAVRQGAEDINQVMVTDFPTVNVELSLEEVFHVAQEEIPLAVVNRQGEFQGVIEPTDIFAGISVPTPDDLDDGPDSPSAAAEAAQLAV